MRVLSSRLLLQPPRINHKKSYLRESSATACTLITWNPFLHTKSASLSLGAIIGIKVPSIAPMTFGKAAIVKKKSFNIQYVFVPSGEFDIVNPFAYGRCDILHCTTNARF